MAQKESSEAQLSEVRQSLEIEKTRHNQEEAQLQQSIRELTMEHTDAAERHRKEMELLEKAQEQLIKEAERQEATTRSDQLA